MKSIVWRVQALMEMEVEQHVGAGRHERSAGRTGQRNGYCERSWDTRVGMVELKVPRVRDGGNFPSLCWSRGGRPTALAPVVQEAYVHGISARKVDELVRALGMRGISKSRVSELCKELDEEIECDALSYAAFPAERWQKIWSNNPLERANKEVKRRTRAWWHIPD